MNTNNDKNNEYGYLVVKYKIIPGEEPKNNIKDIINNATTDVGYEVKVVERNNLYNEIKEYSKYKKKYKQLKKDDWNQINKIEELKNKIYKLNQVSEYNANQALHTSRRISVIVEEHEELTTLLHEKNDELRAFLTILTNLVNINMAKNKFLIIGLAVI